MFKKKQQDINEYKQLNNIERWGKISQEELLQDFHLAQFGLNEEQVKAMEATHSKNVIEVQKFRWILQLLESLFNPFNILLFLIVIYEFIMYFVAKHESLELASGIIVLIMIFLSGIVDYFQQWKAFNTSQELKKLVSDKSKVIRNLGDVYHNLELRDSLSIVKKATHIESKDLVPGDLLYLTIGDVIPCDVRVLVGKNFRINQSTLTGETDEVLKTPKPVTDKGDDFINYDNICFMGTSVTTGAAVCMVLNTGEDTYLASIAHTLNQKPKVSRFNLGINWITKVLLISILVIVPIILVVGGVRTNAWLDALVFAISVAVGLTPESLPMIIVANLTKGVKKLAKQKVIIKNNDAIQTLGAIDVLCTDKTGTLTENKLTLNNYFNLANHNDPEVLKMGYLNSYFQTGYHNLLDEAILEYKKVNFTKSLGTDYEKLDELGFDFTRRRISVIVRSTTQNQTPIIVTKGAFKEVFSRSTHYQLDGKILPLDASAQAMVQHQIDQLDSEGARAIALAYKPIAEKAEYETDDESDLIFIGFLTFSDVPKAKVKETLRLINKYNVDVKILTGDNLQSTLTVCRKIKFQVTGTLTGEEMEQLQPDELKTRVEHTNIFCKLNPHQKAQIITILQANKHIVGFLGDGINDSVALHTADVGISVDNASSIAKESANIIMLEKSLGFLEQGIVEGRSLFVNIIKYIKITVAANLGLMLSLVIGTAWLTFSPMASIQLLFQNLLYDFSQLAVVFDRVDDEYILKPQTWNTKNIIPFALFNGPILTLCSVVNFLIIGFGFGVLSNINHGIDVQSNINQFNTTYFTEGAIIHMLAVFVYRTDNLPIIKSRPTMGLTLPILGFCALVLALPYIPEVNTWLQLEAPNPIWYACLVGVIIGFVVVAELMKRIYKHRYHTWLL